MVFHPTLAQQLPTSDTRIDVIHYHDDFLIVLPQGARSKIWAELCANLCHKVGLTIKVSKNKEGTIVSFAGIEFNTGRIVIRLPEKKLHQAWALVEKAIMRR